MERQIKTQDDCVSGQTLAALFLTNTIPKTAKEM